MPNDLFSIGPFTVHTYGLMIAIGFIAAYLIGEYRAKKKGLDVDKLFNMVICGTIGGFLCSKILFYITEIDQVIANPRMLLDFANGFVVYGGIVGALLGGLIYARIAKINFREYIDIAMTSFPVGQFFGRIGCFFAGCCYGKETASALSIMYTHSDFAPNHVHLIPTQLISSALNLVHFFLLLYLSKKLKKGQTASCYLIFYSVGRFIVEFFRDDPRGSVGALSTSQFIAVFLFAAGVVLFILAGKYADREAKADVESSDIPEETSADESLNVPEESLAEGITNTPEEDSDEDSEVKENE